MVKSTLPLLLMLFSAFGNAEPVTVKLLPRACLGPLDQPCVIQLKISWQANEELCLYSEAASEPLLCGQQVRSDAIDVALQGDLQLELRSLDSNIALQKFTIKHLQPATAETLNRRRLRWSLF